MKAKGGALEWPHPLPPLLKTGRKNLSPFMKSN